MSYFVYDNTCPIIDEGIDEIRTNLTDEIEELVTEICPYIDEEQKIT